MTTALTPQQLRRRRTIVSVIVASVMLHLIVGGAAALWVVARYFTPVPAEFVVKKDIRLPAQEREHKMNMAEFDALTPKPTLTEKLVSLRPTEFALPDLPAVPVDQTLPLDPSEIVSDQVATLVGTAGAGGGGLGGGGMGGKGDALSFFGIDAEGKRILLLFDVSSSVVNKAEAAGIPIARIKQETMKLIDGLSINSRFGIIQFTRNYKLFRDELLAATDANRELARNWVEKEWVESGTMASAAKSVTRNPSGLLGVLKKAYALKPDTIFLISDGDFQRGGKDSQIELKDLRKLIADLEKEMGERVPIHFVGFEMKREDISDMKRLSSSTGGKFREVKASDARK